MQMLNRRELVRGGLAAATLAAADQVARAAPLEAGETVIPFLDKQPLNPRRPMVHWEKVTSWVTPSKDLFSVSHYGFPKPVPAAAWRLTVSGLVKRPQSFSLADLQQLPRRELVATLECSGNGASRGFMGAIGNLKWAGAPLAAVLEQCGLDREGREIVFFAADEGKEEIRGQEYRQHFARSLGRADALGNNVILAYEMNGKPLSHRHGAPVRLVVPGWYAIAWVKWLNRLEVRDRRFMNRFMARDYVTIRGEERPDGVSWEETSVSRIAVKSLVARVVRRSDGSARVLVIAWNDGTPLKRVELRIHDGAWLPLRRQRRPRARFGWSFWHWDWQNPPAGEHTLVSRATDARGRRQPSAEDPAIKLKRTYWEANQQVVRRLRL